MVDITRLMLQSAPHVFGLSPSSEALARCGDSSREDEAAAAENRQLIPLMHDTRGTGGEMGH